MKYTLLFSFSLTAFIAVFALGMQRIFPQVPVTPSVAAIIGTLITSAAVWYCAIEKRKKAGHVRGVIVGFFSALASLPIGYFAFYLHLVITGEKNIVSFSDIVEGLSVSFFLGPLVVFVWFAWPFALLGTFVGWVFARRRYRSWRSTA
ncbi:MAG: hypothetical protein JEY79_03590 [Pseudodesulfovibrio sp.]|nr:hypothetical protein [Pseudodesulfovibrio sp.]